MGLSFFDFFKPKNGKTQSTEVIIREFFEAAQEYQIRELCLMVCVDLIANALGKCEIKTYRNNEEIFEREHYMWNVEPNVNQSSSAFHHKWVKRLVEDGEVLIISTTGTDGSEAVVVADSFECSNQYPVRQNEYTQVTVGDMTYRKTFLESEVMHLSLTHTNVKSVIDGMYQSYYRMYDAAVRAYTWGQGKHLKVHVDQTASAAEGWAQKFQDTLEQQVKPFLDSNGAILPEFDGYKYDWFNKPNSEKGDTRDIRALVDDIFAFTARALLIPAVLIEGKVEATGDARQRFLTDCIDPLCDQLQEEANRKRYGYKAWREGTYLRVDSSSITHFDLFANAANVEKLVGSGAFSINDILKAAGRTPINEEWANKHYMTKNIAALAAALDALES